MATLHRLNYEAILVLHRAVQQMQERAMSSAPHQSFAPGYSVPRLKPDQG